MIAPAQTDTRFIMPREVATKLLLGRKLSNTTRKRAMRARATVTLSLAPIVPDGPHSAFYDVSVAVPAERKLAARYAQRPIFWLHRLVRRCSKLRRRLQTQYQRTELPAARQQLDRLAARCDLMQDCAAREIERRASNVARIARERAERNPPRAAILAACAAWANKEK